jgi:hypothetical protein
MSNFRPRTSTITESGKYRASSDDTRRLKLSQKSTTGPISFLRLHGPQNWLGDQAVENHISRLFLAVRVGFEPWKGISNLQLADSALPRLPYLPALPLRIAQNCSKTATHDNCQILARSNLVIAESPDFKILRCSRHHRSCRVSGGRRSVDVSLSASEAILS